jgi:predicted RNA-binding Zn ribbon-like protein
MNETTSHVDPADPRADAYAFDISGGDLALDFANTVSGRKRNVVDEHLDRYGRLVSWARQVKMIGEPEAQRLREQAGRHPRAAAAALRQAIAIRDAIFAAFSAIAAGRRAPAEAIDALNAALPEALAALRIVPERGGFTLKFSGAGNDLESVIHPVVRAASELLTSEQRTRVRECGSDTCAWLFLDRSKNATRRWCDMKVCGNRAKARRHYQKEKRSR